MDLFPGTLAPKFLADVDERIKITDTQTCFEAHF